MHKHLQKMNEHTFEKIFNQQVGFLLFKDFCNTCCDEPVPQLKFYEEVCVFNLLLLLQGRRFRHFAIRI